VRLIVSQSGRKSELRQKNGGFTIIELMIASSVFAILLLVVTAGILSFTRQNYKGIVSTRTQTVARSITAEVSQAIQFGSNVNIGLPGSGSEKGFCIDNKLFSYILGQQVMDKGGLPANHQGYHGLVVNSSGVSCNVTTAPMLLPAVPTLAANQRELLGNNMRLAALDVAANGDLYTIHVRVVYGDDVALSPAVTSTTTNWPGEHCVGDSNGSQYCAISDLTTTVQKRLQ